jgi:hypothetical protein
MGLKDIATATVQEHTQDPVVKAEVEIVFHRSAGIDAQHLLTTAVG